jgi:hypothetical protein
VVKAILVVLTEEEAGTTIKEVEEEVDPVTSTPLILIAQPSSFNSQNQFTIKHDSTRPTCQSMARWAKARILHQNLLLPTTTLKMVKS